MMSSTPGNLQQWLQAMQSMHPNAMELGLERVLQVYQALGSPRPARQIITVAGTNGKGSTVAYCDALARAGGWRVGSYTSPHILCYNERICINGLAVADEALLASFQQVEMVRGDVPLTFFEFGTLAALQLLAAQQLDLALLEVGLGGRLDAVNIIDADVAIITSIGIDHQEWLGTDRESVGAEKAGIFRRRQPAFCNDRTPPASLLAAAEGLQTKLYRLGPDYDYQQQRDHLAVEAGSRTWEVAPSPLPGPRQQDNLTTAVLALAALPQPLDIGFAESKTAMAGIRLAGRFQQLRQQPSIWADVAHNGQAADQLAAILEQRPRPRRRLALLAMLEDKQGEDMVKPLLSQIDQWILCGLDGPRGQSARQLQQKTPSLAAAETRLYESVDSALEAILSQLEADDELLIFGSFLTVERAMIYLERKHHG